MPDSHVSHCQQGHHGVQVVPKRRWVSRARIPSHAHIRTHTHTHSLTQTSAHTTHTRARVHTQTLSHTILRTCTDECKNRKLGCGLRTSPPVCPIVGDWLRDVSSDEYMLVGCPVGYKLENASGHDNLECQKCLEGFYVQDSRNPRDICRRCPSSATCVNGAPPIFQAAKVTGIALVSMVSLSLSLSLSLCV